ncbi:MAG: DUF1592 domain-containing protein [Acidobacteriota bacterium]|nr:DUF1592 domain-containing protein [Acidobacteriota bacterium]
MPRRSLPPRVAMRGRVALILAGTILLATTLTAQTSPSARGADRQELLTRYCITCHNDQAMRGGLTLQDRDVGNLAKDAEVWEKVISKLRGGFMPPPGRPRPDSHTRDVFIAALETEIDTAAAADPDPGRSAVFHRLNRTEYQNAIRDLLAVDMDIASLLPLDGQNFGFDNNGDALAFSPLLLDRYLSVSRHVSRMAIGTPSSAPVATTYHVETDFGQDDRIDGLPYGTRGGMLIRHPFPLDAEYEIDIKLARNYNFQVVDLYEPHQIEVILDGDRVQLVTVTPPPGERRLGGPEGDDDLQFRIPVKAGTREFGVTFIRRPTSQPTDERLPFVRGDPKENSLHGLPWLGEFTITGPYNPGAATETPSRRRVFTCKPTRSDEEATCAASILSNLARRAYRRPVTGVDLQPLIAAYREERLAGGNFEAGIELALQRILLSSSFLFRIEFDPESIGPGEAYQIDDLALVSRLSFFLWNSIPDDQLVDLAVRGQLSNSETLEQQVRRMLADPRARTLSTNFANQWLELRKLEESVPYQRTFPNFDDNLRQAFRRETELLVDAILREDRPLSELLTADYTFVNERLARHYQMNGVYGDRFRRVRVDGTRRGLLGHGSVLTVTSYPNRTSPVLRGVWILTNLLGTPPPEPPPDVPDLPEPGSSGRVLSMRERMVQHRGNPVCSACHSLMDPLGLSLENFNAVGAWRTRSESGEPIDASGGLPGTPDFDGVEGLRDVLMARIDVFYKNVAERMLTYALGRGVTASDMPAVRAIVRDAAKDNYRAQSFILAIVKSLPFQMKRAAEDDRLTAAGSAQ